MREVLYIDVDDVLSDTLPAIIREYNKLYNKTAKPEDIDDWHFYRCLGHTDAEASGICNSIFEQENFWLDLEVKTCSIDAMRQLKEYYDLYIVTTPYPVGNCIPEKIMWIEKHFPFMEHDRLIFIHNKGLLKGQYLIDDKPDNLIAFEGRKILFRTFANRHHKNGNFHIVNSWPDINRFLL